MGNATTYTAVIEWWLTPKMSVYPTCYECDLIWQKILADVIKWKISQWGSLGLSRWVLNPVANDFIKSVEREIWNPSGEGESKIEIEIAVMGPQAQKHLGLLKTGRGKNGLWSGAFKGKVALLTCYFQTSESWERKQVCELRNIFILYTTEFMTVLW